MSPDKIEWGEFEAEPEPHITCACGGMWDSYVKGIALIDGRTSITKLPCPECGHTDRVVRVTFEPEVWHLSRPMNRTTMDR